MYNNCKHAFTICTLFENDYGQNKLFIVISMLKIIKHALKLPQKILNALLQVVVDLSFTTLLTPVISIAFYSEREKSNKFC